jgi:hypothetical protein
MTQNEGFVLAQVRTAQGINTATAQTWNSDFSATSLRFNFDVDGDGAIDSAAVVEPRTVGGPLVTTFGIVHAPRAPCATFAQPEPTLLRVRIALSCLGFPGTLRTFARYRLDLGANESIDSDDRAPNAVWTAPLSLAD